MVGAAPLGEGRLRPSPGVGKVSTFGQVSELSSSA
ncbi:hypothetical protein XHV734_2260 [Xanthomonas hortorum pv. vitians]|nr:hypothetical protein XHV734_2260 [Xanthomonas hortorum pv. vitians]